MGLEDINEELHGREFHLDRLAGTAPYDPTAVTGTDAAAKREAFHTEGSWKSGQVSEESILSKRKKWKRILTLSSGVLVVLVLLGGVTFKVQSLLYSESKISFSVNGPRQVASAESSEFTVVYSNKNWSAVNNVSLIVSYPSSFQPEPDSRVKTSASQMEIALGTINARTDGKISFSGKFYGSQGDTVYLKMKLRYAPAHSSSQFEKDNQYGVSIASSTLSIDMLAPQQSAKDDIVEYAIDYANRSDKSMSNIRVTVEYPEQFSFIEANPAPSEGNSVWYVGTMDPGKQGKILVKGRLSGMRDEVKKARAMIGYLGGGGEFVAYGTSEQLTRIAIAPLSITQTVNGKRDMVANAGDTLGYELTYRNDGNIGLRDVIITMKLDSDVLDYRNLERESGSYDSNSKTLIWKASDIPGLARLAPGEGGTIRFIISVLPSIPSEVTGKNFAIETTAKIDSPDIPTPTGVNKIIGSNTLLTKVNSVVSIEALLARNDSMFTVHGPIPPVAGQETLYTVKIRLKNEYNDISHAKLTIVFPSSSHYQKKYAPDTEAVTWKDRKSVV